MGLRYENLTDVTRQIMCEEIDLDVSADQIYLSNYLTERGKLDWPTNLRQAAAEGTDDRLADILRRDVCFRAKVERRKPKGGITMVAVPHTAAETLSESQFNMYYMRALARQAIETGQKLIVYRAKNVAIPRQESELMIGKSLDATEVLTVLRQTRGVEPSINIPMPNTGITVRLV